ncbi:MAG: type II secretion system F family protein [Planctomycetia bacterium]|nr:type II secretion system F family protein [Planctomycetia bacterium]
MSFDNLPLLISTFAAVSSMVLLVTMLLGNKQRTVADRLVDVVRPGPQNSTRISSRSQTSALPRMGAVLMPDDEAQLSKLKRQLQQAGLYQQHSSAIFLGVKFLCMVIPMLVGLALFGLQLLSFPIAILIGTFVGLLGTIIPTIWLKGRKAKRQKVLRRSLPDALDVIVICLEGGLSLPAAFSRVASELHDAHPLLASEMAIVQREIQLGRSTGEALSQFADRFDAEELRGLSSVIIQAERFGASITKALRVHADSLRQKRYRFAEELAEKAPVKLIFPTVLCIFPALYIIMMGTALIRFLEVLQSWN